MNHTERMRLIDQICDQFEAAWRTGRRPRITDFLSRVSAARRTELLQELVAVDLECRWSRPVPANADSNVDGSRDLDGGSPWTLEDYLAKFPELGPKERLSAELIAHQFLVHRASGKQLDVDEYCRGFPGQAEQVRSLLRDQTTSRLDHQETSSLTRISVHCPHCRARVRLTDDQQELEITCSACGNGFNLVCDAAQPTSVDHFRLIEQLGAGNFGTVWKAHDLNLDRIVALKIPRVSRLHRDDATRFLREARAVGRLRHPNIVSVHEVGRDADIVYIVSDFIPGAPLDQWLQKHPLTVRASVRLCRRLAEALEHAHRSGVIHRDLKPSNVMMDAAAEPHLMDFGLARHDATDVTVSLEGQVLGTPAYMAPEQAKGQAHLADARSDIYALGVILFEMLTGEKPFRGNVRMLLHSVIHDEPPSPRKLNHGVPRDVETICLKCLQKDPRQRFSTAAELSAELRRCLRDEPIVSRPISRPTRLARWCKRNPAAALATSLLLLVSVAGPIIASRQIALRRVADTNALRTRQLLYASDMDVAQQAWQSGHVGRMVDLLNRHRPKRQQPDLRGFEWFYLWRLAHRGLATLSHDSPIQQVAYTPDNRLLVAGQNAVTRWDARTHRAQGVLRLPTDQTLLAITRDGSKCLVLGEDQTLSLQDGVTRQALGQLAWNGTTSLCAAFSPEGNTLALGGWDNAVTLWDVATGEQVAVLNGHQQAVRCLAFSPDGARLASGGYDNMAILWDIKAAPAAAAYFKAHTNGVQAVVFSPEGDMLATASWDQTVKLWDVREKVELRTLSSHRQAVTCVDFSPDGKRLASGSYDHTVRVWEVDDGRERYVLKGHSDVVRRVAFSPDGLRLASGSQDRLVKVWDVGANRPRDVLRGHTNVLTSVAFSPDGKLLASGAHDYTTKLWDVRSGRELPPLTGRHQNNVWCVAFSPDGRLLATGSEDHTVKLWDVDQGTELHTFTGHENWVLGLAFSPDGETLATGGFDHTVKIWDVGSRELVWDLQGHRNNVLVVAYSPDARTVASAGHDLDVRLWDVASGKPWRVIREAHEGQIQGLAFSPDGATLASGGYDKTVRLWNVETGDMLGELPGHADVHAVAFSPDGGRIVCGSDDMTVTLWDANDLTLKGSLRGHTGGVWAVAFSPDGQTLASAAWDQTVRLWRTAGPSDAVDGAR